MKKWGAKFKASFLIYLSNDNFNDDYGPLNIILFEKTFNLMSPFCTTNGGLEARVTGKLYACIFNESDPNNAILGGMLVGLDIVEELSPREEEKLVYKYKYYLYNSTKNEQKKIINGDLKKGFPKKD